MQVVLLVAIVTLAEFSSVHSMFGSISFKRFDKSEDVDADWENWKVKHNKAYSSADEESARRGIFHQNRENINAHNANPDVTSKMALNKFADMTPDEISATYLGLKVPANVAAAVQVDAQDPGKKSTVQHGTVAFLNWQQRGAVTPVKNQLQCGSCWAFSATGALEGRYWVKSKTLVSLSEQHLVDCSSAYGNAGCAGGWMNNAFYYAGATGGLNNGATYPYVGTDNTCHNNSAKFAKPISYKDVSPKTETALDTALRGGPVSIAFAAYGDQFMYYSSGIYQDTVCTGQGLNHGMLLVGTGTENGVDYWLVKNSWGPAWGDGGYIKIKRGGIGNKLSGLCGIATAASYPVM